MSTRPVALLRRNHDFRLFWAGQTSSVLGSQVTAIALPITAAFALGAGAGGVSLVATASYLPNVLLPVLAGHWLQTRRRRRIMIAADAARAVLLVSVPVAYAFDALSLTLLAVVALLVGSASVVFDIGSFAYVPTLVTEADLGAANQSMQGSATVAQVAGPGLAGLLVQAFGPVTAMAVDAASYLASIVGLGATRRAEPPPELPERPSGILSGFREIFDSPFLRALTAHAALYNAAAQIVTVNLVVWVVRDRGLSAAEYGLALSAGGVGAFLGTMLALRAAERLGYGRAFASSLALSTGMPLLIAALPFRGSHLTAALAGVQLVAGVGLGSANVLSVTLRQVLAPRGSLARTNGGYRALIFGVIPLGSALGGVVGHSAGSRVGVAVGALGLAVSALPMLPARIRNLRSPHDAVRV